MGEIQEHSWNKAIRALIFCASFYILVVSLFHILYYVFSPLLQAESGNGWGQASIQLTEEMKTKRDKLDFNKCNIIPDMLTSTNNRLEFIAIAKQLQ